MEFSDVLAQRRSIRHFDNRSVPEDVINRVLETALQSPSGGNVQPYRIAIARGKTKEAIKGELVQKYQLANKIRRMPTPIKVFKALTSNVLPDGDYNPDVAYPGELKQRKFECGMGLYETLGIERTDKTARDNQMGRNFEFFDAPVALFFFMNDKLGHYSALDTGIFLQTLMLTAVEHGLGTCAQGALAIWASPIKKHFKVEKNYKLLCGLSLGYPSQHIVNSYQPEKRSLDSLCLSEVNV